MSMKGTLVRMLSTGRCGTKFMAEVFADQGYRSFHEHLYYGEPSSAMIHYLNMLGDLWANEPEKYYAMESNFSRPYRRALEKLFDSKQKQESHQLLDEIRTWFGAEKHEPGVEVVVNSGHTLTVATPLILRELSAHSIQTKNLILYRNPLKTIHAIYKVENFAPEWQRPYRNRPESFSKGPGVIGAANVWANIYRLADDLTRHFKKENFMRVKLERFSRDISFAREVFSFLAIDFDEGRFNKFVTESLEKPFRREKIHSARNSDLFHDPDFVLSQKEIETIFDAIEDVLPLYEIDWDKSVEDYLSFHRKEKHRVGFNG